MKQTCFRFIFIFLFFHLHLISYGQQRPGAGNGESPAQGAVSGNISDDLSKEAVPYASVTLHRSQDTVLVNGVLSGEKGDFRISQVKPGSYLLRVEFIGYKTFLSPPFQVTTENPVYTFNKISISSDVKNLREVNVSGERSGFQLEMDKKVFNVDKNLTLAGGSAVDILNQVPGITVDIDGNVSLRGNQNVNVFIDGRPSALMGINPSAALEQIPSASIEKIEVITNPSAKYDAEGMSGIINIVLKKNTQHGLNGNLTAGAGTGDKYNGALSLNFQNKKVNLFANYSYRNQQREGSGDSYRYTFFTDTSFSSSQSSTQKNHNINHALRTGAEFTLNPKDLLGFSVTLNKSERNENEMIRNREFDENNFQTRLYERSTLGTDQNEGIDNSINYKHLFADPLQLLTGDISWSINKSDNKKEFSDLDFIDDNTPSSSPAVLQNTYDQNKTKVFNFQSDYAQPFNEGKEKLETGVKVTRHDIDGSFYSQSFDPAGNAWQYDSTLENKFTYADNILAAYAIFSKDLKFVKVKAGVRSEYTGYRIDQLTQTSTYKNNYIDFFPSVFISKTVAKETDVQLSYSKRINRPSLNSLNPIADYSDPLNVRLGNPYLDPELIHSFELSSIRYREKLVLNASLYYRYIVGQIQRFRTVDTNGVAYMKPVNLDNGSSYGAEASARIQPANSLDITLSGNIYQSEMNGNNVEANLTKSTLGGSAKLTSNYKITNDFNVQLTGDYSSGWASVMGTMKPNVGMDIGLRKDFFKRQLSATLALTDVFDSRRFSMDLVGINYLQNSLRKRESRVLTFNLTWKFGRQADNQNSRKRQKDNSQQQQQPSDLPDDF